jgi:hypothetical protein
MPTNAVAAAIAIMNVFMFVLSLSDAISAHGLLLRLEGRL